MFFNDAYIVGMITIKARIIVTFGGRERKYLKGTHEGVSKILKVLWELTRVAFVFIITIKNGMSYTLLYELHIS